MPKSIHNATPCSCCGRLMARKSGGKRRYCTDRCRKTQTAQRSQAARARQLLKAKLLPLRSARSGEGCPKS